MQTIKKQLIQKLPVLFSAPLLILVSVSVLSDWKPESHQHTAPSSPTTTYEEQVKEEPVTNGSLKGKLSINGKRNKEVSPENSFVTLLPLFDLENHAAQEDHEVVMVGKSFSPQFISVRINDQISFKNNDHFKHNVFSSSGLNTFDLGTYGTGKQAQTAFENGGIVKIYCNIHPGMSAFISVSDHSITQVTGNDGEFYFENLVPGTYELKIWNIRGETKKVVFVREGQLTIEDMQINAASYKYTPHKNKFGKAYKKRSLLEDEFY